MKHIVLSVVLAVYASVSAVAQRPLPPEPELPRTVVREAVAIRAIDGDVKVHRDFDRANTMAVRLAGAMQGAPPIVTVVGTGNVVMDVDVATLGECNAQGYRVYVGPALTAQRVNLNATCSGTSRPFQATAAIADFRALLTANAQTFAATAFVSAADGELESPRHTAPFVLRLGAPPVGPVLTGTSIQPRQ